MQASFSKDIVIANFLEGEEQCYGPVVDDFVSWCDEPFLHLNVSKNERHEH